MAVAMEMMPPRRKERIAAGPAADIASAGNTNIPAPIIVPVPIANV
jgi:hypothetical protein